jgi:hypothetical protein
MTLGQFIQTRVQNIKNIGLWAWEQIQKPEVLIPLSVASYVTTGIFVLTSWSLAVTGFVTLSATAAAILATPLIRYGIAFGLKTLDTIEKVEKATTNLDARIQRFEKLQKLLEDTLKGENPALEALRVKTVATIEEEVKKLQPEMDARIEKFSKSAVATIEEEMKKLEPQIDKRIDKVTKDLDTTISKQIDKALANKSIVKIGDVAESTDKVMKKLNGDLPLTGNEPRSVSWTSWFTRSNTTAAAQPATAPAAEAPVTTAPSQTETSAPATPLAPTQPEQNANQPPEGSVSTPAKRTARKRKDAPAPLITPQRELQQKRGRKTKANTVQSEPAKEVVAPEPTAQPWYWRMAGYK